MDLKKITAAIISSAVLMSAASAAQFSDTRGHWAESVINTLADAGVVHGISETEFNPDGTVTRAEFVKMVLGAAGIADVPVREGECLDAAASDWFGGYVQSALDKGLIPEAMIDGCKVDIVEDESGPKAIYSGSFAGNTPIKREEMAYMTVSVYQYGTEKGGLDALEVPADLFFTDVSAISPWAFDGVRHAYVNGLVSGMEDGTFRPHATATRAQAATIISKLLEKTE